MARHQLTTPNRYAASRALLDRASRVVPGGVHSARRRTDPPVCIARATGPHLQTIDGYRYVDYQCGAGAVILGHADPQVTGRVAAALDCGTLTGIGTTHAETALAEAIVRNVPSVEQVLFCNSGSEATAQAVRLARAITGREKVIKFQGHYHGHTDGLLRNCASEPQRIGQRDPHSAGMLAAAVDACLVCRYNDHDDVAATLAEYPDQVAAVIVEPIAHNGPGIVPVPDFLEKLRALCDLHGALLIFDEVISGYRHGLGGFQAIAEVLPDLTTLGKSIANGYPIGVLGGRRDLMERWTTHENGDVVWAGTYNGNVPSVAAALATIDQLEHDPTIYTRIYDMGEQMRAGLTEIVNRLGVTATVCGYGSLFSLWFAPGPLRSYDDVARNDVDLFRRYRRALLARGIYEHPDPDGARSHISAAHTPDMIDRTLREAHAALTDALTA